MTTDEKLSKILAHAVEQMHALYEHLPFERAPTYDQAEAAFAAAAFDLYRKALDDTDIELLYERTFSTRLQALQEKTASLQADMMKLGETLLGPHLRITL